MKKFIKTLTLILVVFSCLFSLFSCSLFGVPGADKKYKKLYEEALELLENGNDVEAYQKLYDAKSYAPAKTKLNELLNNDYLIQYRAARVGDFVKFGTYEQDNNLNNGKETIEWTVCKSENGKLMLVANTILDYRQYYYNTSNQYTWANSDLRKWLNNDFYNTAFLEGERNMICSTSVVTYEKNLQQDETSICKVFILDLDEFRDIKYDVYSPARDSDYTQARFNELKNNGAYGSTLPNWNTFMLRTMYDKNDLWLSNNKDIYIFNPAGIVPVTWIKY